MVRMFFILAIALFSSSITAVEVAFVAKKVAFTYSQEHVSISADVLDDDFGKDLVRRLRRSPTLIGALMVPRCVCLINRPLLFRAEPAEPRLSVFHRTRVLRL